MYILSAQQIAATVSGLATGQSCSVPAQSNFDTLLHSVRTRIEESMNVRSLERKVWVDHFVVPTESDGLPITLRLSNALLQEDSGILINSAIDGDLTVDHEVDRHMGLVMVTLAAGKHKITYSSGFLADETTGVFIDHPEWLQSIAKVVVMHVVRLTSTGAIPKDVSYGALTSAMVREIGTRVYARYMRPRAGCLWTYREAREIEAASVTLPAAEE